MLHHWETFVVHLVDFIIRKIFERNSLKHARIVGFNGLASGHAVPPGGCCWFLVLRSNLAEVGWSWLDLAVVGWSWLGLVGVDWSWLDLAGVGWIWLRRCKALLRVYTRLFINLRLFDGWLGGLLSLVSRWSFSIEVLIDILLESLILETFSFCWIF